MGTITDNGWIQVSFDGTCNSSLSHVINPLLLLVFHLDIRLYPVTLAITQTLFGL